MARLAPITAGANQLTPREAGSRPRRTGYPPRAFCAAPTKRRAPGPLNESGNRSGTIEESGQLRVSPLGWAPSDAASGLADHPPVLDQYF
jgi:hypothetical protein